MAKHAPDQPDTATVGGGGRARHLSELQAPLKAERLDTSPAVSDEVKCSMKPFSATC